MKMNLGRKSALALIAVLLLSMVAGGAYAKYVTQKQWSGSVSITANIGKIILQEHLCARNADGSYSKTSTLLPIADDPATPEDETKNGNHYILLPGLDVPKDPHLVITKDNDMPVYVYVEVVDGLGTNSGVTYTMSNWTKLDGITGPNGGAVYCYKDIVTTSGTIFILDADSEGNTIIVSQKLDKLATTLKLSFYACMYQTAAGNTAEAVYQHYNP